MRILVTGASGFLGSNVMDRALELGHAAIGFTRKFPADFQEANASPNRRYVVGDIRDGDSIKAAIRDTRPSHIVHAAAVTPSGELERAEPMRIVQTNELSTLSIIEAAAEAGVTRVAFISSAAVYAHNGVTTPLAESSPLARNGGLYSLTKMASERLCEWGTYTYGLQSLSLRLGPVYGKHEWPTSSRQRMSVIHRAVALALAGETIRCSKPDAVFDWIFGADAATAILRSMELPTVTSATVNLAGPNIRMDELLDTLSHVIPGTEVEWVESGQENLFISDGYRRAPLDTTRLHQEIGFRLQHTLRAGLESYVPWHNSHATRSPRLNERPEMC